MKKRKINLLQFIVIGIILIFALMYVLVIINKKDNENIEQVNSNEIIEKIENDVEENVINTEVIENSIQNDISNTKIIENTTLENKVAEISTKKYTFDEFTITNPDENRLVEFPVEEVKNVISTVLKLGAIHEGSGAEGFLNELGFKNYEVETVNFSDINNMDKASKEFNDMCQRLDLTVCELTNIKFEDFLSKYFTYYDPSYYVSNTSLDIFSVNGYVAFWNGGASGYGIELGTIVKKDGISNDYYVEYKAGDFDFPEMVENRRAYITINCYNGHAVYAGSEYID